MPRKSRRLDPPESISEIDDAGSRKHMDLVFTVIVSDADFS